LLMMHGIPDHASINETVNAAKELFDKKIKNLVNGVLRQVARNRENIEYPIKKDDITRYLSINYSYPKWLIDKWIDSYGDEVTEDICINLNIN
ncbi:MAG: 16S rRNA (cytosine(967)-C(5))-methyltransferase RsmB, partial [Candidatus Dadabacteria bacterium]|nr:16S rRNA (cytosine(967)-C(5))-methyltransferase RsmB [Candidatus Dadabacteria bacterium]